MADTITQDEVNRAVWAACDTFRGTVSPDIYKDYVLTLLFLKYISDVWRDHYDTYQKQYGDATDLITELMRSERFVLPEGASFYALYDRRHEPGNGERITVGDGRTLGPEIDSFAAVALDIDQMVQTAVAENSLNPANVEAAIRKAVLPRLFPLTGLDLARTITDQVVEVARVGLVRETA